MHQPGRLSPSAAIRSHHGNHRLGRCIQRHRAVSVAPDGMTPSEQPETDGCAIQPRVEGPGLRRDCDQAPGVLYRADVNSTEHDRADGPDDPVDRHPDPAFRTTLSYIDLSRRYYAAHGYDVPYRWATNFDAPFTELTTSTSNANVAVVTTSFPVVDGKRGANTVYAAPSHPRPTEMFTADRSWHKEATHTEDVESFLPLRALSDAAADGRIGKVNHRFFGVPTRYSQRLAMADAEQIGIWCREDDVDLVLLVPL